MRLKFAGFASVLLAVVALAGAARSPADESTVEEWPLPEVPEPSGVSYHAGRKTLFVNGIFTQRIVGLDDTESDALLGRLCHQYTRPEYQCRFRWTPGAVAFWDNRSTQHYASSDYYPQRRVMERITVIGDRPV